MNTSRLIGIVLLLIGLGLAIIGGVWIFSQFASEALTSGGAIVGLFFVFLPAIILIGFGIYLIGLARRQTVQTERMRKERQLLDVVKSRGQVGVHELALELNTSVDELTMMVHQLVGLQVFSGYANWDTGTLYSEEASALRELDKCRNCGGEIKLVGKGVMACPWCGTEYFLS